MPALYNTENISIVVITTTYKLGQSQPASHASKTGRDPPAPTGPGVYYITLYREFDYVSSDLPHHQFDGYRADGHRAG
jgi:hypothetical protein